MTGKRELDGRGWPSPDLRRREVLRLVPGSIAFSQRHRHPGDQPGDSTLSIADCA